MIETLADSKISRTFASLLKKSTSRKKFWRDGRVVDCGGLENRCTERYRGFESLSLRQEVVNHRFMTSFFVFTLPPSQVGTNKKIPARLQKPNGNPINIYYEVMNLLDTSPIESRSDTEYGST